MEQSVYILTHNDCYRFGGTMTPKGVMVHSMGVAQPDPAPFLRQWDAPGVDVCVHALIYQKGAIQTLPWVHRGWHAGTGTAGLSANDTHISFEILEPAGHSYNGGAMIGYDPVKNAGYFADVYENAVTLTAELCAMYDLDPLADGVIISHREGYLRGIASNHADVEHWFPKHGKTMDDFRADVAARLREGKCVTEEEVRAIVARETEKLRRELTPKVYATVEDLPGWARGPIEALMEKGWLKGDGKGRLDLDEGTLRTLVVLSRALGA